MAQTRGRSVPAQKKTSTPTTLSSASPAIIKPMPATAGGVPKSSNSGNHLQAQADALTRMTYEIHLRTVSTLAERLERDVKALVLRTENDQTFRSENEKRLQNMMREIQAVKAHMASYGSFQEESGSNLETLRRDLTNMVQGLREEVTDVSGQLKAMGSQLDHLLSVDSLDNPEPAASPQIVDEGAKHVAQNALGTKDANGYVATTPVMARIQEAVNSTRRWNHQHKTTKLADAQFTHLYFKKQSQRDTPLAVVLQRSLLKRIRLRRKPALGKVDCQPRSLQELCRDVQWQDVIETAKEVLVMNRKQTAKSLELT